MIDRLASAVLAVVCAVASGWLGMHHPLSSAGMFSACLLMAGLVFVQFQRWPCWLLPWLPLGGLMTWTGWLVVEEWDLLVLSAAAGGYARLALTARRPGHSGPSLLAPWGVLVVYAALTLVSADRGLVDAGGLSLGWWQGYREPLNSVRLAKPVFEALLLLPLWQAIQRRDASAASRAMLIALSLVGVATALPVWWERLAFTGLLNFSTDYRATGLFWEMHVGGAALDACLAMTSAFVITWLTRARRPLDWMLAAVAMVIVFYAGLVTFSRIVYIALPMAVVFWWILQTRQRRVPIDASALCAATVLLVGCSAAAAWLFPQAGYRGLLALLGGFALLLAGRAALARVEAHDLVLMLSGAVVAAVTVMLVATRMSKGAYAAYGLSWVGAAWAIWHVRHGAGRLAASLAGIGIMAVAASIAAVAWHWGGHIAFERALILVLAFAALLALAVRAPALAWPDSARWQAQTLIAAAFIMPVVGVFAGGAYMQDRLTTVAQDSRGREDHWKLMLGLLRSPHETWLGYGLGRTPAQLAMSGAVDMRTGDYRLVTSPLGHALALTSGSHVQGWGELFRVSQRVAPPGDGPLRLSLRVKPEVPVVLHAEVCEKHLLYNAACKSAEVPIKGDIGQWRVVELELRGDKVSAGAWYAPRLAVFSIALDAIGGRVDLDDLSLTNPARREMLANGNFAQGLRRWYFSSDRYHMPWHAKNMAVHLWSEQGLLGLGVIAIAMLWSLLRLSVGAARRQLLAPAVAAGLLGLVVVGAVDSVFDMPRPAFLGLWLITLALSIRDVAPSLMRARR